MFTERWTFDFVVYAYVLSLLFSYAALLRPNKKARIMSSILLIVVWFILAVDLVSNWWRTSSLYEQVDPLMLYTWALISLTLCISLFFKLDLFVFCAGLIGITVLAIHLFIFQAAKVSTPPGVISDLILVHITLAITAYAAFSLAGICAMLYLISHHFLKQKKWNLMLRRLPSLDQLEQFSIWLVGFGLLLLFISMVLGAIWAYQAFGELHWTDVKVVSSLLLFLIYTILFCLAWTRWISTVKIAWSLLFTMILVVGNYFLSGVHFSFHHWIS